MTNRVVHFEIPFEDGERAQGFYASVFGWQTMPMPGMDYVLVMTGPTDPESGATEPGFINGGMFKRDGEFRAPTIVMDVENLEESLQAVTAAGGSVVTERTPVGDMGFTAYFTDPEGNLIGLWETAAGG